MLQRQSFLEYCRPLRGFVVYKNGVEKPRYLLYWYNIEIDDIFKNRRGFTFEKRTY